MASSERGTNKDLVQITADKTEIDRRISAFIEHQRKQNDEANIREFCPKLDLVSGCARTNAVFEPRMNCRSHVKIGKVLNRYGPQTLTADCKSPIKSERISHEQPIRSEEYPYSQPIRTQGNPRGSLIGSIVPIGMEERLHNIEQHLHLKPGKHSQKDLYLVSLKRDYEHRPADVYGRLKHLEERILFLEGLSPEYFESGNHLAKRVKYTDDDVSQETPQEEANTSELDAKIKQLKENLLSKYQNTPKTDPGNIQIKQEPP